MDNSKQNKIERGRDGEDLAVEFLKKNGYKIRERNYRNMVGEIDIVAQVDRLICFVEVKMSTGDDFGQPWERVDNRKLFRLKRMAQIYLMEKKLTDYQARIDVVSVLIERNGEVTIEMFEDISS